MCKRISWAGDPDVIRFPQHKEDNLKEKKRYHHIHDKLL